MANERILVVEDEPDFRSLICSYLRSEGYVTLEAADGEVALNSWQTSRPDLLLLDWMLPRLSGLETARRIRALHGATPIIMLTARSEDADVVLGLELGADDYLVKPVSLRQLAARIRALLRRADPAARSEVLHLGDLEIDAAAHVARRAGVSLPPRHVRSSVDLEVDAAAHVARRAGVSLPLTATEFKILQVLAQSPNRVFTRLQLMQASTGDYFEGYERTIDSHISHLRHKLAAPELIQTVHGIGYKLVPQGG